jgi:hypothetical protein
MGFLSRKTEMPTAATALRGRAQAMPVRTNVPVLGNPIAPPFPGRPRARPVRHGLLLGRREEVLAGAGRVHDGGRLCRRPHAEPALRGGLQRAHRHNEVVRVVFDPRSRAMPRCCDLLGEPRPDPGHAPGQRRRHAVPLGDLRARRRAARGGASRRATPTRRGSRRRATARSPPRSPLRPSSTTPRTITSSTSPEPAWLLRDRRHGRLVPDRVDA